MLNVLLAGMNFICAVLQFANGNLGWGIFSFCIAGICLYNFQKELE